MAVILSSLIWPFPLSHAYESDQYSNRLEPISDSITILDQEVNQAISRIAAEWDGPEDRRRFATEVWRALGGVHWEPPRPILCGRLLGMTGNS